MTDTHDRAITTVEVALPDSRRLHPLVALAQASGAALDPTLLAELLHVQRDWEAGEARRAYTEAIVDLRSQIDPVVKHDTKVSFDATRYTYTSLGALLAAFSEPLGRHGFALTWDVAVDERHVSATAILTHRAGHSERVTLSCPPSTKKGMSPAQAIEASITTLRRATACAILGIATAGQREGSDEDPDAVDPARNIRAAAAVRQRGILVEEAEAELGGRVEEWSAADLAHLREWLAARGAR